MKHDLADLVGNADQAKGGNTKMIGLPAKVLAEGAN